MGIFRDSSSTQDWWNYGICHRRVRYPVGTEPGQHSALKFLVRRSPRLRVPGVGHQPEPYVVWSRLSDEL